MFAAYAVSGVQAVLLIVAAVLFGVAGLLRLQARSTDGALMSFGLALMAVAFLVAKAAVGG